MSPTADWKSGTGEARAENQEAGGSQRQSAVTRSWQQNRCPRAKNPRTQSVGRVVVETHPRQRCRPRCVTPEGAVHSIVMTWYIYYLDLCTFFSTK